MTSSVTQTYPVSVDVHLSGGINVRELAVDQQWKKKKKKKFTEIVTIEESDLSSSFDDSCCDRM